MKHDQRPADHYPLPDRLTHYRGRLVVLVDEGTFSAADNLAACLADLYPDVMFIGRPPGAGTGGPAHIVTLTHSGASVGACVGRVYRPSGELIESRGAMPDIEIRWTRRDLLVDRDPDVDAALHILRPPSRKPSQN